MSDDPKLVWLVIRRNYNGAGRMTIGALMTEEAARQYAGTQVSCEHLIHLETCPLEPQS